MGQTDTQGPNPRSLILYDMAISFLESAMTIIAPSIYAIDGWKDVTSDSEGRVIFPEHFASKFTELPGPAVLSLVGSSLPATTCLGLAYIHTMRLLGFLAQGKNSPFSDSPELDLVHLYDSLPENMRETLDDLNRQVGGNDIEIQIAFGGARPEDEDGTNKFGSLRSLLDYWQSRRMMQDSHLLVSDLENPSYLHVFVPLRSILVLDHIIADYVAPHMDMVHRTVAQQMSENAKGPALKWKDDDEVDVRLPVGWGRVIGASWKPTVTSVIRIREVGMTEWSPGFETALNRCSFVGLEPDTEYEVKLTHKNDAGEGGAKISKFKTATVKE